MKNILLILIALTVLLGCQKEEITLGARAEDRFFLYNNGSSMPVRVYGNIAARTFMIMVHGGPGGDATVYRDEYAQKNLETKFAMVYWDQRNSGASQGGANSAYDQVEDFIEDFEKLIVLLKHRYGSDISIFVNGHSWGGYLTPAFLQKGNNQYLVKGWIQTDGAHNIGLLNQYAIEKLTEKAAVEIQANRNVAEWQEIKDYCESLTLPLNYEEAIKLNIYCGQAESMIEEIPDRNSTTSVIIKRYIREDFPIGNTMIRGIFPNPAIVSISKSIFGNGGAQLSDKMDLITIPTLILFGKHDFICPPKLADDIENRIRSVYKRKVLFEHSGHSPMDGADQKAYWDEVVAFIEAFK